jgi:hypothetical protein
MFLLDFFIGFVIGVFAPFKLKKTSDMAVQADEVWNVTVSDPILIYR